MGKNKKGLSAITKISILIIWALLIIFLMFMGINWLVTLTMILISPVIIISVLSRPSIEQATIINSGKDYNNVVQSEIRIRRYAITNLVIGAFATICWLPFGPWNGSAGGLMLTGLIPFLVISSIICAIFVILIIKTRKQHPYGFKKYLTISIIGLILSLSIFIASAIFSIYFFVLLSSK